MKLPGLKSWQRPQAELDENSRAAALEWIVDLHTFEPRDGGTLCHDRVEYAVPGGRLVNWLLVRRDVETIFRYRQQAMSRIFPAPAK